MFFTGTLDGKGFTISDLMVNMNLTSGSSDAGLFGYTSGANIRNIGLLNVDISSSSSDSSSAGGLVGRNATSSIISNSYSTVNVSSASSINSYVGGLVGWNVDISSIRNSYSTVNVSSSATSNSSAGGLVGRNINNASIRNSYHDEETSGQMNAGGSNSAFFSCVARFASDLFKTATNNTGSCSPLAIFFNWQTPFDIDGDSVADEESVRYDSNNNGSVTATDDFVWNFGTTSEYPFIASIPGTPDEQAVRMASGFLRFSNTALGRPSTTDFVFFYDIGSGSSITTSGTGVQGTTAGNYAIEDAVDTSGVALATPPTVTNAGVINGVNSLAANSEFYLKVTFTRGTTPMASYTTRYRFKK